MVKQFTNTLEAINIINLGSKKVLFCDIWKAKYYYEISVIDTEL